MEREHERREGDFNWRKGERFVKAGGRESL